MGDDTWQRVGSIVKCVDDPVDPTHKPVPVDPEPPSEEEEHDHDDHEPIIPVPEPDTKEPEQKPEDKAKEDPPEKKFSMSGLNMTTVYAVGALIAWIL